jgi:hypothetical protein
MLFHKINLNRKHIKQIHEQKYIIVQHFGVIHSQSLGLGKITVVSPFTPTACPALKHMLIVFLFISSLSFL